MIHTIQVSLLPLLEGLRSAFLSMHAATSCSCRSFLGRDDRIECRSRRYAGTWLRCCLGDVVNCDVVKLNAVDADVDDCGLVSRDLAG